MLEIVLQYYLFEVLQKKGLGMCSYIIELFYYALVRN